MKIKIVSLKIKREKTITAEVIDSSAKAGKFLVELIGSMDREHFIVMALGTNNVINCVQTVSIGTLSEAPVHPREVFKIAILSNSLNIIIAHNHPGGTLNPSKADIELTEEIKKAGELLHIPVIDHIIVTDTNYYSFAENGLL
ncbi:JAB domain-containing protein [Acetivibrio cellulolyticus]|uniref:JAB domain-containing protein n=1 Tax=Acetivibrio cellulolyticus TaxID=35830 RepID=UPI0001E2C7A6|nr:JAB domain-containing protein [Acetivibrio cellulolyticus]